MTIEELRSKLDTLELAREAAERELRLARERSERLSALERDVEDLLEAYEERCIEALEELSPEERREVYKLLDLTVEAHPDGRLEAALALNASIRFDPDLDLLSHLLKTIPPRKPLGPELRQLLLRVLQPVLDLQLDLVPDLPERVEQAGASKPQPSARRR